MDLESATVIAPSRLPELQATRLKHGELLDRLKCLDHIAYEERAHREGNRAGRLLAWLTTPVQPTTPIQAIRNAGGEVCQKQVGINYAFRNYYESLYSCNGIIDSALIEQFLDLVTLPQLTREQYEELARPLTLQEVRNAIVALASGKTPGTDGIPVQFY